MIISIANLPPKIQPTCPKSFNLKIRLIVLKIKKSRKVIKKQQLL